MKNTVIKPPENGKIDPYFNIIRKGDPKFPEYQSSSSEDEYMEETLNRAIDPVALLTGESFWNMISTQYFPTI